MRKYTSTLGMLQLSDMVADQGNKKVQGVIFFWWIQGPMKWRDPVMFLCLFLKKYTVALKSYSNKIGIAIGLQANGILLSCSLFVILKYLFG